MNEIYKIATRGSYSKTKSISAHAPPSMAFKVVASSIGTPVVGKLIVGSLRTKISLKIVQVQSKLTPMDSKF